MEEFEPDVVVSDILTLAPALAAERAGLPRATLIPHVYPVHEPGLPFFAFGAQPPRTPVGRAVWRAALPVLRGGAEARAATSSTRRARGSGCRRSSASTAGSASALALVATFPQLEYPRALAGRSVQVTGPMASSCPTRTSSCRAGDEPLVLVAPSSTAQDPELRAAAGGAGGAGRRAGAGAGDDQPARAAGAAAEAPANARAGRLALLLAGDGRRRPRDLPRRARDRRAGAGAGAPLLCCPAVGDMAENGGAGRVGGRRPDAAVAADLRRVAAAGGAAGSLGEPSIRERARRDRGLGAEHTTARERGAELVERLARRARLRGQLKLRGWDSNPQPLG